MSDPNGLLYIQNRYYNPYLCRFINADPSGFSGGLNWYAYANGNPVSYLDPFGLGAAGESSFSSWLDNNTYDFSPAGQFMSAYQQTQSQMQQFQSFQTDSPNGGGLSSFLNGTPFLGGAKMTAEQVFTGHDLITGESVEGLSWLSVAAIGASLIPLPLEAGAEEVAAETTVAEQGRNALGQFTSKVGGQAAPGSTAVGDFIQNATQNGWSLVDREVSFNTPFGMRRYDAVLTDPGGVNWGFEIKSSESAFSRWEGQQFSADRWINMNGGATAIGKQSGLQIGGSAKLLWPTH